MPVPLAACGAPPATGILEIMTAILGVRSPHVVHETIDGDTVIVDMALGTYYRLEGAAAEAWQCLAAGASAADLRAVLSARFEAPGAEIEAAVAAFLSVLGEYKLIAPCEAGAPPALPAAPGVLKRPFPGMAVHRFTDFQELLRLDPVHEVDEIGWPAQPAPR